MQKQKKIIKKRCKISNVHTLDTVVILFANNIHTAPHHLSLLAGFLPREASSQGTDRGWYCNLWHDSGNLMVDPCIAFLGVAKHWHSHAVACFLQGNVKKKENCKIEDQNEGRIFEVGIFIETLFLPKCNSATPTGLVAPLLMLQAPISL